MGTCALTAAHTTTRRGPVVKPTSCAQCSAIQTGSGVGLWVTWLCRLAIDNAPDDPEQPTEESIDVTARFVAALWAGPAKIAADLEDDIETLARQIGHEFNVVVNIVSPRGTRRDGVSVSVNMPSATFDATRSSCFTSTTAIIAV